MTHDESVNLIRDKNILKAYELKRDLNERLTILNVKPQATLRDTGRLIKFNEALTLLLKEDDNAKGRCIMDENKDHKDKS